MMHRVQQLRDWATRRRLTACLLLVLSLLMVLPVSLPGTTLEGPLNSLGKDTSAPFPCQTRACGCQSAKQCWKKCCCFTNAQKVAWAKANRVKLPTFVVAAAKREAEVAPQTAEVCCLEHVRQKDEAPAEPSRPEVVRSDSPPRVRIVIGLEALQCSGVEQTGAGVLISIQPPQLMTVVISNLGLGEVTPLCDSPRTPCLPEPPTPPPRDLAASPCCLGATFA